MSSSPHLIGPTSVVHNYMQQEISDSLKSNASAQAIRANNRHHQLSASSSSSQQSGGVALWNIPPMQNGVISRGTTFLRFRVKVTGAAGTFSNAYSGNATGALGFQGPGALTTVDGAANAMPELGNAMSLIQRLTLFGGSGGAVIDQINFVNDLYNLHLAHTTNTNYLNNDANITLGVQRLWDFNNANVANATEAYIDCCVPVPLSVFNNSDQHFPSHLLRSPLTLQVDLAPFARSILRGSALSAVTDYTIEKMFLCYEVLEVPTSLVEAERHAIQSSAYVMPVVNWLNTQVTQSVLSSYNLGLNCSSLRSVYVLPLGSTGYSATSACNYNRAFDDSASSWGSGVDFKVYIDGSVKNSSINSDPVMQFSMLKQALHNSVQTNVQRPGNANFSKYINNYFALGVDCLSFDDDASLFGGSPCTNLNIQAITFANGNNLATVMCCYDSILAISGDGLLEIKR
jgi:hypothetical protein